MASPTEPSPTKPETEKPESEGPSKSPKEAQSSPTSPKPETKPKPALLQDLQQSHGLEVVPQIPSDPEVVPSQYTTLPEPVPSHLESASQSQDQSQKQAVLSPQSPASEIRSQNGTASTDKYGQTPETPAPEYSIEPDPQPKLMSPAEAMAMMANNRPHHPGPRRERRLPNNNVEPWAMEWGGWESINYLFWESMCCPCVLAGRTRSRIDDPELVRYAPFNPACFNCGVSMIFLGIFIPCYWYPLLTTRREIRYRESLEGGGCSECMAITFCPCKAMVQAERELMFRKSERDAVAATAKENGVNGEGRQVGYQRSEEMVFSKPE